MANEFQATYLLHQLLGEEQLRWLKQFTHLELSDNEARALILAKEIGAVDNAGLRAITALDTLSASQVLKRLHHQYRLLEQGGAGSATYYRLIDKNLTDNGVSLFTANDSNTEDLASNTEDLAPNTEDLTLSPTDLPEALQHRLDELTPKARKEKVWPVIVWLCALQNYKTEQSATLLNRQVAALRTSHLNPLREQEKLISYTYPEVINHPEQAYQVTAKGLNWLKKQGICIEE